MFFASRKPLFFPFFQPCLLRMVRDSIAQAIFLPKEFPFIRNKNTLQPISSPLPVYFQVLFSGSDR